MTTTTTAPTATATTDSVGTSAAANRARIAADRAARTTPTAAPAAPKATRKATAKAAPKATAKAAAKAGADDTKIATAWRNGETIAALVIRFRRNRPQIRRAITRTLTGGRAEFARLRATTNAGGSGNGPKPKRTAKPKA